MHILENSILILSVVDLYYLCVRQAIAHIVELGTRDLIICWMIVSYSVLQKCSQLFVFPKYEIQTSPIFVHQLPLHVVKNTFSKRDFQRIFMVCSSPILFISARKAVQRTILLVEAYYFSLRQLVVEVT